jgi:hypothetical protein
MIQNIVEISAGSERIICHEEVWVGLASVDLPDQSSELLETPRRTGTWNDGKLL